MVMGRPAAGAMAARISGRGLFRPAAVLAALIGVVTATACDDLWRDERSEPEKARQELQKKTSAHYKKCIGLAIDADAQAAEAHAHPSRPKPPEEILEEVMHPRPPSSLLEEPETPSAYETECGRPYLRGCLLPAEPVKTVEEFVFRVNACPQPEQDCAKLSRRISELQGQRRELRPAKNDACNKRQAEDCRYRFRQLEAVIDAIAMNEIAYERVCLE